MSFSRRLPFWGLLFSITLGSFTLPAPSQAQQAVAVSAEQMEKARKHMEEGQELYLQKRYLEAAQAFQRAYAIQPFAAFLFNEAVCYEKAGEIEKALATFKRYQTVDPNPPDLDALKVRIARLEAQLQAKQTPDSPKPPPDDAKAPEVMHSLLVLESNPSGAPAQVWQKVDVAAAPFAANKENPGWKKVSEGSTPLAVTLVPGRFHIVVDRWQSYNRSDDEIEVATGRVVQYRANLSQGDFMGFLRVVTEATEGAQIYLDDPPPHRKKPWGLAPHGELVPKGKHQIWVEAPGYEAYTEEFTMETGQQKVISIPLQRLGYGFLLIDGNSEKIQIFIDDQEQGIYTSEEGPLKVQVPQGSHRLRAVAKNKKLYEGDVQVPAGQLREVHLLLSSRYSRGTAWGASVFSAASLGAGIYLGLRSNAILTELREDRRAGNLAPGDSRVKEGRTYAILADAGFTASALLAGYAVYEFLRDPMPPSTATQGDPREFNTPAGEKRRPASLTSLQVAPVLAPGQGVLFLRGAF